MHNKVILSNASKFFLFNRAVMYNGAKVNKAVLMLAKRC